MSEFPPEVTTGQIRSGLKQPGRGPFRDVIDQALILALSLCPRPWRFRVALGLARASEPLWRRRLRHAPLLDGYREVALHYLLAHMVRCGVPFDPEVRVCGVDPLPEGGVVLVTAHFWLNRLYFRRLVDQNREISAMAYSHFPPHASGSRVPIRRLAPDTLILVRVRQSLREGRVVAVPVDRLEPCEGCRMVETAGGPRYVSDTIMRFAEAVGAAVVYCVTRIGPEGDVVVSLRRPSSMRAEVVFEEFCDFLSAELGQIAY